MLHKTLEEARRYTPHGMFRIIFDDGSVASDYNPYIVGALVREAILRPECIQVNQVYLELPPHDYVKLNIKRGNIE